MSLDFPLGPGSPLTWSLGGQRAGLEICKRERVNYIDTHKTQDKIQYGADETPQRVNALAVRA